VAVLINKALIEIPPKFANRPPVNPEAKRSLMGSNWYGASGLTDDIRFFGKWMRDKAERRIGHLYPKVVLPKEYGGGEAKVIAWLWTRTVTCPNPACGAQMPLTTSFWLSRKKGRESWVKPIVDRTTTPPTISFKVEISNEEPPNPPKVGRGAQFQCLSCGSITPEQYIKNEGVVGRMGVQLMATVTEGKNGRSYLSPSIEQKEIAEQARPDWKPNQELSGDRRAIWCPLYGLTTIGDLFSSRQLVALNTFSDLVSEAREYVMSCSEQDVPYADAVATYLGMNVSRLANRCSTICFWDTVGENVQQVFARQGIPMVWDFAEANPLSDSTGNFLGQLSYMTHVVEVSHCEVKGEAKQLDATNKFNSIKNMLISTDPPYYDNIGYADLSDFFYVWLRRSLKNIYPDLFSTMLVPKTQELVAIPYRFGGDKGKARRFFEEGLSKAFASIHEVQHPDYPLTVYYAFKQSEADTEVINDRSFNGTNDAIASTGWETMLEGLIRAGFTVTGTWPVRTELIGNLKKNIGALASSIVLVCRPRLVEAQVASRRQFLNALRAELPAALKNLQRGSVAPVDLAQASIGPGMAIYSRYSKVVESDGTPLRVRTALQLINRALDEALAEQEGEYDAETRWAVAWFEEYAMNAGEYGRAETLSKAKNTAVQALEHAGLVVSKAGKVRLVKREELSSNWNPKTSRLTVWEVMQRMIHELLDGKGDTGAGDILRQASAQGEVARDLAYRLFVVCERKGWTQEALAYNSLVTSWLEISRLAHRQAESVQQATFLE